jgi:phytoene dehydrogenase-like protein
MSASKFDYDVIVVGSGPGGLTAATALARSGKKVLVCEQHYVPGGWTHSFIRGGYLFSPGVHYIGGLEEGGFLRNVYEGLGLGENLAFSELNPEGYDHFFIGERRIDFPKGKERLKEKLKEEFPHEAEGIEKYLDAVSTMMENLNFLGNIKGAGDAVKSTGKIINVLKWARKTGKELIDAFISDPVLKGVLSGQSGDHGLPPSRVSAFVHAGITHHYFNGGYYPVGGARAIPEAFVKALKKAGGEIRLKTPVERILLESGKVKGVTTAGGEEITAPVVISNADPEMTFGRLVGRENLSGKLKKKLDRVKYSVSCVSLFFAVDMDLRGAGLDSGNYWFYENEDVNELYEKGLTGETLKSETPPAFFVTVTTLKDPTKMKDGIHTLEAFSFTAYEPFEKWANEKPGRRAEGYKKLKEELTEKMLNAIDKRIPGIKEHTVFTNLGTPLTNEHYIYATRGSLYGIEKTPSQVGPGAFSTKTEIDGLYMVGASTLSHGVAGATMTGLTAAKKILGCRMNDFFKNPGPALRIYPAEEPEKWPEL